MRPTALPLLLLAAVAVVFGCGTEHDIFGSLDNVPFSGVAPYTKVDLDPDEDLVQPFLLVPPSGTVEYREPAALVRKGVFHLWVEQAEFAGAAEGDAHRGSVIVHFTSPDGLAWSPAHDAAPVLVPERGWESAFVGSPTVIHHDGTFWMWYAGGDGAGIGLAASPDGDTWTRVSDAPVLYPTDAWEGGTVFAPCVVYDGGLFRMWYSAGDGGPRLGVATGRAIGYAQSADGLTWTKAAENPVLTAWQPWESPDPESPEAGLVSSPTVVVDHTIARTIYRMWYTGNRAGDPFFDDASVGYAGSLDGLHWEKAEMPVNPVLQEVFPLDFAGITDFLLYDECQPSVVRDGDLWIMYYVQVDALNLLLGGWRGVAVATNPPLSSP